MGVGKEKDWARKDKLVPCKSGKIVVVLMKKIELVQKNFGMISTIVGMECRPRSRNKYGAWIGHGNQFGNHFGVCRIYSQSENVDVLIIHSTQLNICT